jgi:hypothetical protein
MPKKKQDIHVQLHPMTLEEVLTRMLKTPPVNPAKKKARAKQKKAPP